MFDDFDFTVLEDPNFKEDSVREELIAPLLRRLGYTPSGTKRVQRSKALVNPFLQVGSSKRAVKQIPDYTLFDGDRAILVLDAKAPTEDVRALEHVGQAYSYAVHLEIRCEHFALCNGRELAMYHIHRPAPVFELDLRDLESRWTEVETNFAPEVLQQPGIRNFLPDFGLHITRTGLATHDEQIRMPALRIDMLARLRDDSYTAGCGLGLDGTHFLASFDLNSRGLERMTSCLASPLRRQLERALHGVPYVASIDGMLEVDLVVKPGKPTHGQFGKFDQLLPLVVLDVDGSRLNRSEHPPVGAPPHVFSLRRAFEQLQAQ